jgi:cytochrome c-type biogenesis protein CcmH/NrfF
MKRNLTALTLSAVLLTISFSGAQTPDANQEQKNQEQKFLALVKEVQTQQAQMAENQKQIETKLAAINETVRTARIYAGRAQ